MDHPINILKSQRMSMSSSEQQTIDEFWMKKQDEIEAIEDFSKRAIPMSRLKKVIHARKGKMMMTCDMPSFLTKACEIFVQELSLRSWMCANSHHRRVILESDIAEAIASMESYEFLNDVLCKDQGKHNSAPHPKPMEQHPHINLTDQPLVPRHPLPNEYQMPQFIHQSARYSPFAHPLPSTNDCHVPLPLTFLPKEACSLMATTITPTPTPVLGGTVNPMNFTGMGLGLFGNKNSSTAATFGVMTAALPNIPDEGYMSTDASVADTYYVDSASTNVVVSQDGAVTFQYPYDHPTALELASPLPVVNGSCPIFSTGITELNHTEQEVAHIGNTTPASRIANANDCINHRATIGGVDHGQQKEQPEIGISTDGHHLNVMHGRLDAEVVATPNVSGDYRNINWDETDMVDDSLLVEFWEQVMMK